MESSGGEKEKEIPEIRSQFTSEKGISVDLNCGRYCTEAAIKWWAREMKLDLGDVFHEMLEDPKYLVSWAPWREGKNCTISVPRPKRVEDWRNAVAKYGPLIISGPLGEASLETGLERLGYSKESLPEWLPEFITQPRYVGHFILIVEVDLLNKEMVCLDPLKAEKGRIRHSFEWILPRIQTIYAVDLASLQEAAARRHAQLKRRRADAQFRLRAEPGLSADERDELWNDIL